MKNQKRKLKIARILISNSSEIYLCNALMLAHVMFEQKIQPTQVGAAYDKVLTDILNDSVGRMDWVNSRLKINTENFPAIFKEIKDTLGVASQFEDVFEISSPKVYRLRLLEKHITLLNDE